MYADGVRHSQKVETDVEGFFICVHGFFLFCGVLPRAQGAGYQERESERESARASERAREREKFIDNEIDD
jgi:hypothetical protein